MTTRKRRNLEAMLGVALLSAACGTTSGAGGAAGTTTDAGPSGGTGGGAGNVGTGGSGGAPMGGTPVGGTGGSGGAPMGGTPVGGSGGTAGGGGQGGSGGVPVGGTPVGGTGGTGGSGGVIGPPPEPTGDLDRDGFDFAQDNCPRISNQDQTDTDRDGAGDACDPCPDAADDACVGPVRETCNGLDDNGDGQVDEGLVSDGMGPAVVPTSLDLAVDASVAAGLQALVEMYDTQLIDSQGTFLVALALLERRDHFGAGEPLGFAGQTPDDQARLITLVQRMIDDDPALLSVDRLPYTYMTGGNLMVLAIWTRTGGPDDVGAGVSVSEAIANGTEALRRIHLDPNTGWSYTGPGSDLSTSHFVENGLAAVMDAVDDPDGTLAAALGDAGLFVEASRRPDGGLGYGGGASSTSMTAAGTWLLRLGGLDTDADAVQLGLGWISQHSTWEMQGGEFLDVSQFYAMWAMTKLMASIAEPGLGLSAGSFGETDPADTRYPDAPAGAWFDIATHLLAAQDPAGQYSGMATWPGWSLGSGQAFSILALERSTGGVTRFDSAGGTLPACADGVDNDADGLTDAADPQCRFACTASETAVAPCRNGLDDDGDGLTDAADPACGWRDADSERDAACNNGVDDDGDGALDFWFDRGCTGADDDDETDPLDPARAPACADDADNDSDGLSDFPADPDCAGPFSTSEATPVCAGGVEATVMPGARFIRGDSTNGGADLAGTCGGAPGQELVYALLIERAQQIRFSTVNAETALDTVLYVRRDCADPSDLGCVDDLSIQERHATLTVDFARAGLYFLVVDAKVGGGPFRVDLERTYPAPVCANGLDDDQDGIVDLEDPGCASPRDESESEPLQVRHACANGLDDDADGHVDFPTDPGCLAAGDDAEDDPAVLPACGNGRDDDGDGLLDYPEDPGCLAAGDNTEDSRGGACANGDDDDGDGLTDYPFDPGCEAAGGLSEDRPGNAACAALFPQAPGCTSAGDTDATAPAAPPECANGADDDGDGLVDFPGDPECDFAADREAGPRLMGGRCSDHADNDGDGLVDFPNDPGCAYRGDVDEQNGNVTACANGADDDGDGRIDYPFDAGCLFAADDDEADDASAACNNRLDDDGDGLSDFPWDPGCQSAVDTSEVDARQPPACQNGVDDDRDGRVDFPDDANCPFAAAQTESGPNEGLPRCADRADNDGDGHVDADDLGCVDARDNDETDPAEVSLCGDGMDNDGDGLLDFPSDPGCKARGDLTEDQSCRPAVAVGIIPPNGRVRGTTQAAAPDLYAARCGGLRAPEAVYRYTLAQSADLTFSLENPGTDYDAVVYVRRDCEDAESSIDCGGAGPSPTPSVTLPAAAPGDYFVFVDGGGVQRFVSSGEQIDFPPSPDGFVALRDLGPDGWSDGGNDAFDIFGTTVLTVNGQTATLDVSVGDRSDVVGGFGYHLISDFPSDNVWRMRILPTVEGDPTPVTIRIGDLIRGGGNLGCDIDCIDPASVDVQGYTLNHFVSTDVSDPDTVQMLVPSDPDQWGNVTYENATDNVLITATDITLPATFYVALTNGPLDQAAAALVSDLVNVGGDPIAPVSGNFELTASEAPVR
jgi:hypothetical protein